jgi:RimJ/RimL family protein N-acetyltransferase
MHPNFNPQPKLSDGHLTLRPLQAEDRDNLHQAASDPVIWEGHPAKDRHLRAVFDPYFDVLLASTSALVIECQNQIIGCSRYYEAPDHPNSISIGYTFLSRPYWGGQTNRDMKDLMLTHAFGCVDTVWLHIDPSNIRSQRATARLGATHAYTSHLDLGLGTTERQSWSISNAAWAAQRRPT